MIHCGIFCTVAHQELGLRPDRFIAKRLDTRCMFQYNEVERSTSEEWRVVYFSILRKGS